MQERDRLESEARKLRAEGKLAEAIAPAEAMLANERVVLGPASEDAIESQDLLDRLGKSLGEWAVASMARREILDRRVDGLGRDHWRLTDARLALEGVEAHARMTANQRRRLVEADQIQASLLALGDNVAEKGLMN